MAAYGTDDFVTGSDLSDFSEFSDEEIQEQDVVDIDYNSEDDGRQYCICGEPSNMEMIACDDELCAVVWWHYGCAGLSADTIPKDTWVCSRCLPLVPESTSSEQAGTSSAKTPPKSCQDQSKATQPTKKGGSTSKGKKTPKSQKPAVKRPEARFSEDEARGKAREYFTAGLQQIEKHPIFRGSYPAAVCALSLVAMLLCRTNTEEFYDFCITTVTGLWLCIKAGDNKYLKPEGNENLWKAFHKYRLEVNDKWVKLLKAMGIHEDGQHVYIVCQHLLQAVLQLIIEDRNLKDKPVEEPVQAESKSLSPQEEQVLRYVSGYIPFSLFKCLNNQKNDTALTYCKFLKSWKVDCEDETARTFLQYTNDWVDKQNRGGLFRVKDGVYLLFRAMEQETCKYLTVNNLKTFAGCDIQSTLLTNISTSPRVQTYWCSLTQGKINGNLSSNLLNMVVKKWIKIRANAFINVYLDLKKASHGNVGKKAEKALRKDL